MEIQEIGSCLASIEKISTVIDGSVRLTLDINPSDQEIISKLLKLKLLNKPLIQIGIVSMGNE